MNDKELLKRLRKVFIQEAKERLTSMSTNLIALENNEKSGADNPAILEIIYREAHSLKGAARSINLLTIETLFQTIETLFSEIQDGTITYSNEVCDILLEAVKLVDSIISSPDEIESEKNNALINNVNISINGCFKSDESVEEIETVENMETVEPVEIVKPIEDVECINTVEVATVESVKSVEPCEIVEVVEVKQQETIIADAVKKEAKDIWPTKSSSDRDDTIRIDAKKLDSLLLKSEKLIGIKLIFREQHKLLKEVHTALEMAEKNYQKINYDYLYLLKGLQKTGKSEKQSSRNSVANVIDYLSVHQAILSEQCTNASRLFELEKENQRSVGNMIDEFLLDIKETAMMPFSNILDVFPMMVRDISKKLGKDVTFTITGDSAKIDRRILQEIKDPLIHLLRNSIDHGIEKPEIRREKDKSASGKIGIDISQNEGGKLDVIISDDGNGIDVENIKEKLISNKMVTEKEVNTFNDSDLIEYIFHSGFSTSRIVTDLSGRGLGMTIVREKIEKLGGTIKIINNKGCGTSVIINLPVTLATYKGILIRNGTEHYILPSMSIEKVIKLDNDKISSIENKAAIVVDNKTYPLINLYELFGMSRKSKEDDHKAYMTAAILGKSREQIALEVDDIIEEQEIILKDLGCQLPHVKNIAGATILNSGEIVPVLNVQDLFNSAKNIVSTLANNGKSRLKPKKKKEKHVILVVEDSITSRTLLKNILESAGYIVKIAIDGVEGFTELKSSQIDILVSDIEMPRMNGFELTAKVRADKRLSELPIVLVTSRSTRADKEKGIEAGANAYIIKSNFDQNNLLDTIKSLL
jgi:two-component system, chemotaxis family, sensor kinase CheA